MTTTQAQVTVVIAGGRKTTIEFSTEDSVTVADVLAQALVDNGMPESALKTLYPVVNGQDAEMTDKVLPGSAVDAGVGVANG